MVKVILNRQEYPKKLTHLEREKKRGKIKKNKYKNWNQKRKQSIKPIKKKKTHVKMNTKN